MKIEITIVIPCWKRSFLVDIILRQLIKIKSDYTINILVGVSNEDHERDSLIKICEKYHIKYILVCNDFLGKKLNILIEQAFKIFPDTEYIMNFGSDDLLHEKLFDIYKPFIDRRDKIFGIDKCYFLDKETNESVLFCYPHKIIGAGRMLHKSIPFPIYKDNIKSGLDNNSIKYLIALGYNPIQIKVNDFPYLVDVKTDVNICKFNTFKKSLHSSTVNSNIIKKEFDTEYVKQIVNSYNCEFGYELLSVLPYAFWLYQHDLLEETISGSGSEALYYFSPKHKINKKTRKFGNVINIRHIPNSYIHRPYLDLVRFKIPPYKEHFKNKLYKFKKPTVCICNRYNVEWKRNPINFFSLECLDMMFTMLKDDYQIVYFGVDIPESIQDNTHSMSLGDYKYVKENHKEVIIFQDLLKNEGDWNTTMLKVFANCDKFITMNGGYSILASFFGGQNIIYSKQGDVQTREIKVGSFWRWYPVFGNSQICYVPNYDDLYDKIQQLYVTNMPTVNILIRTCKRPLYFDSCIKSIQKQTYKNINVIIGVENDDSVTKEYAYQYPYRVIHYDKITEKVEAPVGNEYGIWFPYNDYLNTMTKNVGNGWIIYLDDDDMFTDDTAIETIVNAITDDNNLLFWRCSINNIIIPHDVTWDKMMTKNNKPVVCDICGSGFMFHSKNKNKVDWGMWKRGDYRVAKQLYKICKKIYIDKVLIGVQECAHGGKIIDKNDSDSVIIRGNTTIHRRYNKFNFFA